MPRTLESIVRNHEVAVQRRAAGKPIWDRQLKIKHFLQENPDKTSDERAAWVANRIAETIKLSVPAAWLDVTDEATDWELLEVVDGMADLRPDSYDDDDDFSPLEDLNNMLDELYDWADSKRVWIA